MGGYVLEFSLKCKDYESFKKMFNGLTDNEGLSLMINYFNENGFVIYNNKIHLIDEKMLDELYEKSLELDEEIGDDLLFGHYVTSDNPLHIDKEEI